EGMKIRVPEDELRQESYKKLAANPEPMAFTELFSALQQGTIDGQSNPSPIVLSSNFHEVQKYLSIVIVNWTSAVLEINSDTWNSMPDDRQEILKTNAIEYRDIQRKRIREEDQESIGRLEKEGIEVNYVDDLDDVRKEVDPVYEEYREHFGDDLMDLINK